MRSNKSFDTDAQRRSFASLRSFPLGAGQLRLQGLPRLIKERSVRAFVV